MATKYSSKLANHRVLVIGGTSGIGFCVAEGAVEQGAIVTVASSRQESIDKTVSRLQSAYPQFKDNVHSCLCDIGDVSKVEANIDAAMKFAADSNEGTLDHVVFTATPPIKRTSLEELNLSNAYDIFNSRVLPALFVAKHASKWMKRSNTSSITMTSGQNIDKPSPGWLVIVAGGGSVDALTRAMAVDLAPIRVNTVSPGLIQTELLEKMGIGEEMVREFAKSKTLTGTVGRPEDTAEAYLYVMKDGFVTGDVVRTNGGGLLAP